MASTPQLLGHLASSTATASLSITPVSGGGSSKVRFLPATAQRRRVVARPRAAVSGAEKEKAKPAESDGKGSRDERVVQVHSAEEFDSALQAAKNRLVVVEFAATHSVNSSRIYPCMVDLSRTCGDVDFLLVMGDESEATRELCRRESITQVPHFSFYKGTEKVHEEEGIGPAKASPTSTLSQQPLQPTISTSPSSAASLRPYPVYSDVDLRNCKYAAGAVSPRRLFCLLLCRSSPMSHHTSSSSSSLSPPPVPRLLRSQPPLVSRLRSAHPWQQRHHLQLLPLRLPRRRALLSCLQVHAAPAPRGPLAVCNWSVTHEHQTRVISSRTPSQRRPDLMLMVNMEIYDVAWARAS